jgi:hypothetical protein
MRSQGDFQKIYEAAKSFYRGDDVYGGRPHNPVVRHTTDGIWMLESGLDSEERADAECRLVDFDSYFYETYQDENYIPSLQDEEEFLTMLKTGDE